MLTCSCGNYGYKYNHDPLYAGWGCAWISYIIEFHDWCSSAVCDCPRQFKDNSCGCGPEYQCSFCGDTLIAGGRIKVKERTPEEEVIVKDEKKRTSGIFTFFIEAKKNLKGLTVHG